MGRLKSKPSPGKRVMGGGGKLRLSEVDGA